MGRAGTTARGRATRARVEATFRMPAAGVTFEPAVAEVAVKPAPAATGQ